MKLMSGLIKHSLQPSRKLATDYSLASQPGQKPPDFSSLENLNRPVKTEMQTDIPVTTTSGFSVAEEAIHINNTVDLSNQAVPLRVGAPVVSDSKYDSPSKSTTANVPAAVQTSSSTQSLEAGISGYKSSPVSPAKLDQLKQPEQHQLEPMKLQNSIQERLPSADLNQQNTIDREFFSTKTSTASETQTAAIESVNQSIQTDSSPKPLEMEFSSETPPGSINSELQHTDIDAQQEIPVAVAIKRQATTLTFNTTSPVSAQSKTSNTAKSAETPQVRIGNINILVDDQAAARPAVKPVSNSASPSIPFGLRGL